MVLSVVKEGSFGWLLVWLKGGSYGWLLVWLKRVSFGWFHGREKGAVLGGY